MRSTLLTIVRVATILAMLMQAGAATAATVEDVIDCYKVYASVNFCDTFGNCSIRLKLSATQLALASRCVAEQSKCRVAAETGDDATSCFERADRKCEYAKLKRESLDGAKFAEQRAQTVDRCSGLSFEDDLLSTVGGLGFANIEQDCADIGITLASIEDVLECTDLLLSCEIARTVATTVPRSLELLGAAGYEDFFGPAGCLVPAVPGNATGMDRRTLLKCQKSLQKSARRYVRGKMVALSECLDELFRCTVAGADCTAEALYCTGKLSRIPNDESKFKSKSGNKCSGVTLEHLRDGLGLGGPGHPCSAAASVDALIACLADEVGCSVGRVIGLLKPRAAELLGTAGLLGDFPCVQ